MKKLILFLCFMFVCGIVTAEPPLNEKYSFKAFPYHGLSFKDIDAKEFNNTLIRGSCFYQEWVEGDTDIVKDIFPDGMKGVTFLSCNLDNVYVDETRNTIIKDTTAACSYKRIQFQNDLDDWIMEKNIFQQWQPKEPMNKEQRLKANKSIDPKDIPVTKLTNEEREQFIKDLDNAEILIIP